MLSRNVVVSLSRGPTGVRNLSTRASTILGALDIPCNAEVPGVYDGKWGGSGDILETVCPTTGEVLARVQSVSRLHSATAAAQLNPDQASPREFHQALDKSKEAHLFLRKLPAPQRGDLLRQVRESLAAKVRPS